jgi:RimJ/RimL family protein N-acetyltransferase
LLLKINFEAGNFSVSQHTGNTSASKLVRKTLLFEMNVPSELSTDRLLITPVARADADFILELVNTEGWIRFIGDKNITSPEEAGAYIQKISANEDIAYWVVKRKDDAVKIGIVTYIKRDYLNDPDIGFAFLPNFSKMGYAYEAATALLNTLIREYHIQNILATTNPENINSIKLLKRMGLDFEKAIEVESETLHVYSVPAGKFTT